MIKDKKYMRWICVLFLAIILPSGLSATTGSTPGFQNKIIKLNPGYKINRAPKGVIIVSGINEKGDEVRHEFDNFYADVIWAASRKQSLTYVENNLQKKYYLSKEECRREMKHALNVLTQWNIVILNDIL